MWKDDQMTAEDYLSQMDSAIGLKLIEPDSLYYGRDGHLRLAREIGFALNDFGKKDQDLILSASYGRLYVKRCNLKPILDAKEWQQEMQKGINIMPKKCPMGGTVLYLDCLECEDKLCKGVRSKNEHLKTNFRENTIALGQDEDLLSLKKRQTIESSEELGRRNVMDKIAIIDADLIGRTKHRFPNLACEKISGYYKDLGYDVELKLNYKNLSKYKKVFISKVFTDTPINESVLNLNNVQYGGTGFYYDKAPKLPDEIEHHMPDYHLYDDWINYKLENGGKKNDFKYYTDYSIGFMTRGCFRQCQFCVNKNYKKVYLHSALEEFYDPSRKKICLLDDNFLGCSGWKEMLLELQATNKPFQFKQGLDERLLTDEKCELLFKSKYDGEYIFAFDNIADYDLIESKLRLIKKHTNKKIKFYVLCGFDRENKWDDEFWKQDVFNMMKRVKLLMGYQCLPYIMRFNRYLESPYQGVYKTVSAWCNQPSIFKNKSLREFGIACGCESMRNKYIVEFEEKYPEFKKYMDMRYGETKMENIGKIIIGIDQSYQDTGISVAYNGTLKAAISCYLKPLGDNSSKRKALKDKLYHVFTKVSQKASDKPTEVSAIIERIRLQSQGFINIDYIKSIGALNAMIVDVAKEFNYPVYSVDTRNWKSKVVGTSKEKENKYGIDPKKYPTILWCIKNGYENKILIPSGRKKKGIVKYINGIPYTYNDNISDSIAICMYGFLPKSQQSLKEEH
jgi:hypothetical protein